MFNNLSMQAKVLSLLSVLAVAAVSAIAATIFETRHIDAQYSSLLANDAKGVLSQARANRQIEAYGMQMYKFSLVSTDAENRNVAAELSATVQAFNDRITDAEAGLEEDTAAYEEFRSRFRVIDNETCAGAREAAGRNDSAGALTEMKARCEPALKQLSADMTAYGDKVIKDLDDLSDEISDQVGKTVSMIIAAIGLAILLVGGLAFWLTKSGIVRPLQALNGVMSEMQSGRLNTAAPGQERRDELGAMARTLESFRQSLADADRLRSSAEAAKAAEFQRLERERRVVEAFQGRMVALADAFVRSSGEVSDAAQSLSATAEETSRQAQVVTGAAEEAATNVQTAAAATEEMSVSVREIGAQVHSATAMTNEAAFEAARTQEDIRALSDAAQKIGEVVSLINDIAAQTNLLALNATIEAARAGDAGKGFAVVASEVKALAMQTGKATGDIGSKVAEIQTATQRTVASIDKIVGRVDSVRNISATIAAAVEQQGSATQEIAGNTARAADGTQQVTENIFGVGRAAEMTGAASSQLMALSGSLSQQASDLQDEVRQFVDQLRAA